MKHYVLTRWNKISPTVDVYNHPEVKDPERWNADRMVKFEKYCLPGMMNQTDKDFGWVMGFSEHTPEWILKKYSGIPNAIITFDYPADYVRNRHKDGLSDGDWLCTSRLDNDDAVSRHYIEKIKGVFREQVEVVDFSGYQHDTVTGKWYHSPYSNPHSPFVSLFEQVGTPIFTEDGRILNEPIRTAFRFEHTKMPQIFPARYIDEKMYVQVIHGLNLRCKIRGVEIAKTFDHEFWNYRTTGDDPRA